MKITKPTLILDKEVCIRNIRKMAEKASRNNVEFRPHFKTHQSHEVGRWFREFGIDKITVSSVSMAKYFVQDGWSDITIAIPVNILELDEINTMASRIKINVLVDSIDVVELMDDKLKNAIGIFIKIDTGYHRTGVDATDVKAIEELVKKIDRSNKMEFKGFLTHSGNTYTTESRDEILNIYNDAISKLKILKVHFINEYPDLMISFGDTPSLSILDEFSEIDEIRPGNFVYYDLMQYELGACDLDDIALKIVCPVISKSIERNEVVVYGGGVHLSKDRIQLGGKSVFGKVDMINNIAVADEIYLKSVSQEHGIINVPEEYIKKIKHGDLISIIPVHSCLTLNLHKYVYLRDFSVLSNIHSIS
tara:strand:- start:258 stop:1346 length:1089 start_codon:yes stop_codon:yes gene_type:complete